MIMGFSAFSVMLMRNGIKRSLSVRGVRIVRLSILQPENVKSVQRINLL